MSLQKKLFARLLSQDGPLRKKLAPYQQVSTDGLANKDVLEIGAGSGANISYYKRVKSVTLLEPNIHSHPYLKKSLRQHKISNWKIEKGIAEMLPYDDNSFDVVVTNLVLCSVQDVSQSLSEIKRVLRPWGHYFFLEHAAAHRGWVKYFQKIIRPLWLRIADGCDCHRDISNPLREAGFGKLDEKSIYEVPTFIFKPILIGTAQKIGKR